MSSIVTGRVHNDLHDLDIDELVDRLTPGEIQKLLDDCDPDDSQIPPSLRCNYKCEKEATGPLDRKKLLDYITDQAVNTPDIPDIVPHVKGTVRGKKWNPPPKPKQVFDDDIEISLDLGDDVEVALNKASAHEIVELAGIMGLHSLVNQEQYHSTQSDKAPKPDPETGFRGVTKATPLKVYPEEAPNTTNPSDVVKKIEANDPSLKVVNLNNVPVSDENFMTMFTALEKNEYLEELSAANCGLGDTAAILLSSALETNKVLRKLNVETNNIAPHTLARIFESLNVQQTLVDIKASNQQAQFLGNKVEMAITKAIENNKTILKVGLHFQFGDCRNRVAVQLQKNLDRQRLKRVAQKLSNAGSD